MDFAPPFTFVPGTKSTYTLVRKSEASSNNPKGLDIDASKPHPEFLLRLVRLLELSRSPEDCQSDGICMLLKEVLERAQAVNRH
jgi:hypothetical protein